MGDGRSRMKQNKFVSLFLFFLEVRKSAVKTVDGVSGVYS